MMSSNGTFSALLALCSRNLPITGEFPTQRPVTRSFDVFFYLRLNKGLNKQLWGWWFEMHSRSLWRHCNDVCAHQCGIRVYVVTRLFPSAFSLWIEKYLVVDCFISNVGKSYDIIIIISCKVLYQKLTATSPYHSLVIPENMLIIWHWYQPIELNASIGVVCCVTLISILLCKMTQCDIEPNLLMFSISYVLYIIS